MAEIKGTVEASNQIRGSVAMPTGGGGSTVSVNPILTTGTKTAEITVDGRTYTLYAPAGGGSLPDNVTVKTRIDFDGSAFKIDGVTQNYKQLYDHHITKSDFAFVVYGDRAYLLSYVQDGAGLKEMRFQSVIATTENNLSYVKTSGIYVTSSDGVNITSIRVNDINGENKAYKTDVIDDSNKASSVWYPSVKAVVDYFDSKITPLETLSTNILEVL